MDCKIRTPSRTGSEKKLLHDDDIPQIALSARAPITNLPRGPRLPGPYRLLQWMIRPSRLGAACRMRRQSIAAQIFFNVISSSLSIRSGPSTPSVQKYRFRFSEICAFFRAIPPRCRGAFRDRHEREVGCGGRDGA
jgi:hypothetical protein